METKRLVYDAIKKAFDSRVPTPTWTQLEKEVSEYGSVNMSSIRQCLLGNVHAHETTLSLLMITLGLEVVSVKGDDLSGPLPELPKPKYTMRQDHATPHPENRLIFNAIIKAWKKTGWSITQLWKECQKHGKINNKSVYLFVTGNGNLREDKINIMLETLGLEIRPIQ